VAQATLDSLGTSQAFASLPYPGGTVVGLPGLIAGVTGGKVALPAYPAYAYSDDPTTPYARREVAGYSLRAHRDGKGSAGGAAAGLPSNPQAGQWD
jgi:hypothetical protein